MKDLIPDGVWPTMITPFTSNNKIDYAALEIMINWYIERGVDGLFAVCQSSEMWLMSLQERIDLATFVAQKADGRVPVMASGHIAGPISEQVEEMQQIADTGVQAIVLVTNRLAGQNESEQVFKTNLDQIIKVMPESMPLGFYECPYPYKRLLSPALLRHCEDTGRFNFLKDTSCDLQNMKDKLAVIKGDLKIFNANAATLYDSLKAGISGYSGVMTNFHPELYTWGVTHWREGGELVEEVFDMIGFGSVIERQFYPVNAKYLMQLDNLPLELYTRVAKIEDFTLAQKTEVEQLYRTVNRLTKRLPK
jgi:4-hydroxy-tetrahydrodipicolinate synthase